MNDCSLHAETQPWGEAVYRLARVTNPGTRLTLLIAAGLFAIPTFVTRDGPAAGVSSSSSFGRDARD
jgi:hypothetical protein